jgi:membrane-bound lytic murein transglycosylase MltF
LLTIEALKQLKHLAFLPLKLLVVEWIRRNYFMLASAFLIALLSAFPSPSTQLPPQTPELPPALTEADGPLGLHTGDLDGMQQRRMIRVAVFLNKTHYFIDSLGQPRGLSYDALTEFERFLNRKLNPADKIGKNKVLVVLVPANPSAAEKDLTSGKVDIIALPILITEDRGKRVDFVQTATSQDVVVSGPAAPVLVSLDDLAGKEVYLNRITLSWERLSERSKQLKAAGKPVIQMKEADSNLQWEDMLEMANAGVVQYTVVPLQIANIWKNVFTGLKIYPSFPLIEKGQTGWAVRKDSPKLREVLEEFAKTHREGTAYGEKLISQYLKNPQFVKNNRSPESIRRFQQLGPLFRKYAEQYEFPWLLIAAEAFQESGLNHDAKSPVGAIGVMQVMPSTAATPPVSIPDVSNVESNINAGVKLLKFIRDDYFKNDPMDIVNKSLMTLAAYNAGPARLKQCRELAAKQGLDPNLWFNNVEYTVAKKVGAETVNYVSNIYKYYIAYKLNEGQLAASAAAKPKPAVPSPKPTKKK